VLGALSRPQAEAGMSVGELSRFLMVSRQNLSGVLARLERAGHVERVADVSDRRSRRVRLTPAGEALWAALEPLIHDFYDQALSGLSFDDRVDLLHYLNRLHGNMMKI
jgi:DNA-binding MarR family transcriptional regulator